MYWRVVQSDFGLKDLPMVFVQTWNSGHATDMSGPRYMKCRYLKLQVVQVEGLPFRRQLVSPVLTSVKFLQFIFLVFLSHSVAQACLSLPTHQNTP